MRSAPQFRKSGNGVIAINGTAHIRFATLHSSSIDVHVSPSYRICGKFPSNRSCKPLVHSSGPNGAPPERKPLRPD